MTKKYLWTILFVLLLNSVTAQVTEPWNDTDLIEAENIYEVTVELNNLLGGIIGIGFILVVFVISFVVTSANTGNVIAGLASGSFIATVSAVIMLPLQLISYSVFTIVLLLLAFSVSANILLRR